MVGAFWRGEDELDLEQSRAIKDKPANGSFLLMGPAGSGKTNILLLRAKWLTLMGITNFKIVTFTNSLNKFIQEGCIQYKINPESAVTQMSFLKSILEEFGVRYEPTNDFEMDRSNISGKVMSLIESGSLGREYVNTLLIDEAQDYTDTELCVFRNLADNLVLAMDSRQSIYRVSQTLSLLERLVDGNIVKLKYHYRSGLKLCKLADEILAGNNVYEKIHGSCCYPESSKPSSVKYIKCNTFESQMESICEKLKTQIDLYPNETIGVLFPKNEQVNIFKNFLSDHPFATTRKEIKIDTIHGSKGLEFRAVHIGGAELLNRMGGAQKRLIYTGILRGKTSLHIYYSGHIPGYLETALMSLEPPPPTPTFPDLFKK